MTEDTLEDIAAEKIAQSWGALAEEFPLIRQAALCHTTTRGGPLSFRDKPSLIEMYTDFPTIEGADVCKAVQTGVSELIIQMHLEAAGWRNRIAALVLPTHTLRDRFVQRRVNTLLMRVPEYRELSGGLMRSTKIGKRGAENLKVKQFGDGALLFLGSNSANDFVEFSCDILTVDEFDNCDAMNLAKARDRLRNSPNPQLFRIGNPSIPTLGIAALFDEGDRRLFHWRCQGCGERQPIDWFANVVRREDNGTWVPRDTKRYHALLESRGAGPDIRPCCRRCSSPFVRTAQGAAWVAANPGKRRSYRMTRLDVMSDRLWALFVEEWIPAQGNRHRLAAFYASVLGQGYEDSAAKLTHEMIDRCCVGEVQDWTAGDQYKEEIVVAGIDVGTVLNVVIDVIHSDEDGNTYRRAALVCAVSSFEQVKDILKRYHVDVAVADARPETRKVKELRDWALWELPNCTVWLAQFHPTDRVGAENYGMRIDYEASTITADRTQLMDATFDEIRTGLRVFPVDVTSTMEFFKQMQAPVRKLDPKGRRFIWDEGSKPDHYRLADCYARMAADQAQSGGGFIG